MSGHIPAVPPPCVPKVDQELRHLWVKVDKGYW